MRYYPVFCIFVILACSNRGSNEELDFPVLETSLNSDTLLVGDILELRLSFSDTSLLRFVEVNGSVTRIYPPYMINGEFVGNEEDTYLYSAEVLVPSDSISKYVLSSVVVGIVFPNPMFGEGDVTLTKAVPYIIQNR